MCAILDQPDQAKARISARFEHLFWLVKRQFGYAKVCICVGTPFRMGHLFFGNQGCFSFVFGRD